MKKLVAFLLSFLILANSVVCVSASAYDSNGVTSDNTISSESTEISDSEENAPDFFEVAGYRIPTETGIDVFEYDPYTFTESGKSYKLFTNGNDDYVQSELYRDGVLRQKSVGIKGSPLVIYTEAYELETQEEIDSAELEISEQDDLILIIACKAVSHETIGGVATDDETTNDDMPNDETTDDEVTDSEIMDGDTTDSVQPPPVNSAQTNAVATSDNDDPMHYEPALNTGLTASTYSGDSGYY